MKKCPHCNRRNVPEGGVTCLNSYCQEAGYLLQRARNARKGSARARDAWDAYRALAAQIDRMELNRLDV